MSRKDRLLWGYVAAFLVVALAWAALASGALAQEADKGLTVTVTLTADQVKALRAYRELPPMGPAMLTPPMPASTPDYTVVPTVKPVLSLKEWIEAQLVARLDQMIADAERLDGDVLAGEMRGLTGEQRKALRAQMKALKEKK